MNTKNYKEIGRMNRKWLKPLIDEDVYNLFCNKQTNYFERKSKTYFKVIDNKTKRVKLFNKKQFLKDCGVGE